MTEYTNITIPSRLEVVSETDTEGTYEVSHLYPGYGNTLGNALRRMLLSSIPGAAVTSIRIKGVPHEFSTIDGVHEDALMIVMNVKNIRVRVNIDSFPQTITLTKKGKGTVTAGDFETPSQVEIVNKDLVIAEITDSGTKLEIEADIHKGVGFCTRENLHENFDVGSIVVDAVFSPVKQSSYEVHNMRVGDRTDFNRLRIFIKTDGSITPKTALETALRTMVSQFEAMLGFQLGNVENTEELEKEVTEKINTTPVRDLDLSANVVNALEKNNVKTIGDILRKGVVGIRDIPGIGVKAIEEIKLCLEDQGIVLKDGE